MKWISISLVAAVAWTSDKFDKQNSLVHKADDANQYYNVQPHQALPKLSIVLPAVLDVRGAVGAPDLALRRKTEKKEGQGEHAHPEALIKRHEFVKIAVSVTIHVDVGKVYVDAIDNHNHNPHHPKTNQTKFNNPPPPLSIVSKIIALPHSRIMMQKLTKIVAILSR